MPALKTIAVTLKSEDCGGTDQKVFTVRTVIDNQVFQESVVLFSDDLRSHFDRSLDHLIARLRDAVKTAFPAQ